jgi:hypothetical protein
MARSTVLERDQLLRSRSRFTFEGFLDDELTFDEPAC